MYCSELNKIPFIKIYIETHKDAVMGWGSIVLMQSMARHGAVMGRAGGESLLLAG